MIDLAQTFQRGLRLRDTYIQGLNEAVAAEGPEVIEGVSDIDSEHALAEPNPQPDDSSSGSASSVGNLDDF